MAAQKFESSDCKLIDKIMAHVAEDFVEKMEDFLVNKTRGGQMVNVGEFCSSLIRQNVLNETDLELRAGLLEIDAEKWTEKAIRTACSKKAFGPLVVAVQSSGNARIVQEIYEWLENLSKDSEFHNITPYLDAGPAVATNNVILNKLFQHLSSSRLSRLASVNNFWKKEALIILRKRDNLLFFIKSDGTCSSEGVKSLTKDIIQLAEPMKMAPVRGIRLDISPHGPACPSPDVIPLLEQAQGILSPKILYVTLSENWLDHQNCPKFKLAKALLQDLNGSLTDLQLKITTGREELIQLVQDFTFPNLKILRLEEEGDDTADEAYQNYIKALLSLAPNLQQLHLRGNVDLEENFLGEILPEVLFIQHQVFTPFIAENIMSSLRLKSLSLLSCSELNAQDFQRFMTSLPVLLRRCCSITLTDLCIDPLIALSLMSQGIVLENVEHLFLCINCEILEELEPRILENFKNFDFKQIFPKLSIVIALQMDQDFEPLPDHVERLIEAVPNFNARPDPGVATNLHLLDGISEPTLAFYVELFPNIQELDVADYDSHDAGPISFGSIWKQNWTNLKTLHILAKMEMFAQEDLDSVFCGIFPQEVAELRGKSDDYLKTINIVPVNPSFTRLKDLSSLTLEYSDDVDVGPATILSKVTGLVAFAKLPTLRVFVTTKRPDIYEALKHMKPFASVVLQKVT